MPSSLSRRPRGPLEGLRRTLSIFILPFLLVPVGFLWGMVVLFPAVAHLKPVEVTSSSQSTGVPSGSLAFVEKSAPPYKIGEVVEAQERSGDPATVVTTILGITPSPKTPTREGVSASSGRLYVVENQHWRAPDGGTPTIMVEEQFHGVLFPREKEPLNLLFLGFLAPHRNLLTLLLAGLLLLQVLLRRSSPAGEEPEG